MKKLLFILAAGLIGGTAIAQDLPQPSPAAKLEQRVGLTDITIEYSRPGVKGRTIFGELVPYDEIWRLGANACTKFTSTTDILVMGERIPAGTYAMFAIPSSSGAWKVIFNTDTEQWGAGNYDEAKNVATIMTKGVPAPMTETFTFEIKDLTNNSGAIVFAWEKVSVTLPFDVETNKMAEANIEAAIQKGEDLDKVHYRAASYYFKSRNDEKKALAHIHKGLNAKEGHALYFLRAQILEKQGHKKEAIESAEKAYEFAMKAEAKGWADYIKEHMDEWKK